MKNIITIVTNLSRIHSSHQRSLVWSGSYILHCAMRLWEHDCWEKCRAQICRKAANLDSWLGSNASKMKPWLLWHWTSLSCTEWWPASLSKYFAGKLTYGKPLSTASRWETCSWSKQWRVTVEFTKFEWYNCNKYLVCFVIELLLKIYPTFGLMKTMKVIVEILHTSYTCIMDIIVVVDVYSHFN